MESRKMVLMTYLQGRNGDAGIKEWTCGHSGGEERGTNEECSIDIYTLQYVK